MLSNLGITPRKFSFEPTQTFFWTVRAIRKCCQNNYSRRCHLQPFFLGRYSNLGSRVLGVSFQNKAFCKVFLMCSLIKWIILLFMQAIALNQLRYYINSKIWLLIFVDIIGAGCGIWLYRFLIIAFLSTLVFFFFCGGGGVVATLRHWQVFFGVCQKLLVFFV